MLIGQTKPARVTAYKCLELMTDCGLHPINPDWQLCEPADDCSVLSDIPIKYFCHITHYMVMPTTWETGISHVKVAVVVVLASGVCQNDILKFSTDLLHLLMDISY
jgi:hypothetical protein